MKRLVCVAFVLVVGAGCATTLPMRGWAPPAGVPVRVELDGVPFVSQPETQCGPASLAMVLSSIGHAERLDDLVRQVYSPARRGSLPTDMTAAVRRRGLVAYPVSTLRDIVAEVAAENPVIVLQNVGSPERPRWHYAVAIGYDLAQEHITLRSGLWQRSVHSFARFEQTWVPSGRWGLLVLPPRRLPATVTERIWVDAIVGLERAHQWEMALASYELSYERWPASLGVLIGLGNSRFALNDLPGAEQAFRLATQHHPEAPAALNNLAHVMRELRRHEEARATVRRTTKLEELGAAPASRWAEPPR